MVALTKSSIENLFRRAAWKFAWWPRKNYHAYFDIRTGVLPNGTRVITRYLPGQFLTDVAFHIEAGSCEEVEGNFPRGTAHFFEHLPFNGSSKYASGEGRRLIRSVGGSINATTSQERTVYLASVEGKDIPLAISVLSDMVCRPDLKDAEIARERPAIRTAWLENQLNIPRRQNQRMFSAAYGADPKIQPAIGDEESISSIERADLERFHKKNYTANRTIIAIEGDVDHDTVMRQLVREFDLPPGGNEKPDRTSPPYTGGAVLVPDASPGTRITLAFHAADRMNIPEISAFRMLSDLLAANMDSALGVALRFPGLVYGVNSSHDYQAEMLVIEFNTFSDKVEACLEATATALLALRGTIDGPMLDRYKQRAALHLANVPTKIGAEAITENMQRYDMVIRSDAAIHGYLRVTPEEVRAAIDKMLQEPPTFVATGDIGQTPSYDKICAMFSGRPSLGPATAAAAQVAP